MVKRWGNEIYLREVPLQIGQILILKPKASVLLNTFPRLGRITCPRLHTVGRHVAEVISNTVAQTITRSQHDNQHKDTPCHGEAGQEGTQFVLLDGAPNLPKVVEIKHDLILSLSSKSSHPSHG